ncbi:MAG: thiamine-binding protein [Alphaproteobacteria bacterium]
MIVEIQCLPSPSGTDDDRYAYVDAAIAVVQRSGLRHQVSALGTTVEGTPVQVWGVVRETHEACLKAGADKLVSVIKVAQTSDDALTMHELTAKFDR